MSDHPIPESRAAALRHTFDAGFALPASPLAEEFEDFLAIRVSGDPYAIRLLDIRGLISNRKIITVPAAAQDLLGLAGIRGGIVPVFGLASILGYPQSPESTPWMVLAGAEEPIALAFSDVEGYLRVAKSAIHADENKGGSHQTIQDVARTEAGVRGVIHLPLIVANIRSRTDQKVGAKGSNQ